jgi:hypothetical protein
MLQNCNTVDNQGDQIGRIFAHWVALCFDHFLITEVATFLGYFYNG